MDAECVSGKWPFMGARVLSRCPSFGRLKLLLHVADTDEVALSELRKGVGVLATQWWKSKRVIALIGVQRNGQLRPLQLLTPAQQAPGGSDLYPRGQS